MSSIKSGLVVSNPVSISGTEIEINGGAIHPQELRHALLFWDELAWPSNNLIYIAGGADEQFLEQSGILFRPRIEFQGVFDGATAYREGHLKCFLQLNQQQPGKWTLAQGEDSFLIKEGVLETGRGYLANLYRAVPVPDKDVPLQDILEFREKRSDELFAIRNEIGNLYDEVRNSIDLDFSLQQCINRIDKACTDLIKVKKERKLPFRLSDVQLNFNLPIGKCLLGFIVGQQINMPLTGAIIGLATETSISFNISCGFKGLEPTSTPYRYVSSYHREVFGTS